jgi:ATP-binding cassette subfamily F protein 3
MSILTASNLAKSYGPHDVFSGVSLEVPHGAKIALVGPNGSGKTTLLRLLAGLENPSAGTIHRAAGLHTAYLPQQAERALRPASAGSGTMWDAMLEVFDDVQAQATELRRLEAAMMDPATRGDALQRYGPALEAYELAGGYIYQQRIRQVLSGLGFDESDLKRSVAQLSGGQKTRALLARLLLEQPGLLLLDEPINHLDLAGIEWLESYLKAWKGAVIVVAHDRAFLDIVGQVWELEQGRLERYRGNYTAYVAQRTERRALQQTEYERQQQLIAHTEEFIHRNIAGQRSREAKGRQKRLARIERVERPQEYRPLCLDLGDAIRSGDLVVGLHELAVGYEPEAPLFTAQEFELRRGQRVALLGPNGSGKTTLIRTMLGEVAPLAGRVRIGVGVRVGYFAQGRMDLDYNKTVLETVLDASDLTASQARSLLGRYRFSGDDAFKRVSNLSGGEQARVALAVLALQGANLLILDEPTNHLDIPSQEVLQEALSEFGGTLLIVTHDRYLINRLATHVWAIEGRQLWEFKEGYEAYHEWREQRRQRKQALPETAGGQLEERRRVREARKAAGREAARRTRRQSDLEEAIHQLETRLTQLEVQLAAASEEKAVERVRQLGAEYASVEVELDGLLAAWADAVT